MKNSSKDESLVKETLSSKNDYINRIDVQKWMELLRLTEALVSSVYAKLDTLLDLDQYQLSLTTKWVYFINMYEKIKKKHCFPTYSFDCSADSLFPLFTPLEMLSWL